MYTNNNSYKKTYRFIICAIATVFITACSSAEASPSYQYQEPAKLGDGWETASLEEAGIDSERLAIMMDDIKDGGFENLYSLLIVKDGKMVFEVYFHGHNPSNIGEVASVTKSVTSITIGIAIDQGYLKGPDQYLAELLPSYAEIIKADPIKKKLQLRHILSMTSGLEWDEDSFPYGDNRNDATSMERSPDPVKFILERSVIREPGTQFQYSGANSMLLSAILQEATGMTLEDFANQNLFGPLGIDQYRWDSYRDGHTNTDGGLSLRSRDMAKIGQLILNNGWWNGVQVISPEWVTESTRVHTTVMPGIQYGYQWWRDKQAIYLETVNSYFAAGYGGQLISIYPDQNMIIIFTGETSNHDENTSRINFLRVSYLLPATVPAMLSKVLLWSWYLLTIGGLIFLVLECTREQLRGFGWFVYWLLIVTLFGPLGLAAYLLSFRNLKTKQRSGWRALGIAVFLSTGNITAIILLSIYQILLLPEGSVFLLVIPISFLVNWLAFIAPIATSTRNLKYRKALWKTLLSGFISACFVLAGIFPAIVLLTLRWPEIDVSTSMFWSMMTACGITGAVTVYPFSLWLTRRKLDFWPAPQQEDGSGIKQMGSGMELPRFKDAWGAFLLGLFLLITVFGFLVSILS